MKATFAHACSLRLLRLYPHAWRERYADEAAAVLEASPVTFLTLLDLVFGMLDAYVHSDLFTERKFVMLQRLRKSQITIYCSAVFFSIVLLLYRSQDVFFWYSTLAEERPFHLAFVFIDLSYIILLFTTLIGSFLFIAVVLKQVLTGQWKQLASFYAWGLISVIGIATLPFISEQISKVVDGSAWVIITINFPAIMSLVALFGNEICVALVFIALKQMLISSSEKRTTFILWLAGLFAPSIPLLIAYRFFPFSMPPYAVSVASVLISLIVFGSIFLLAQRGRRTEISARLGYLHFIPTVLITLSMSAILVAMFFLLIELHISISDLRLVRYTFLDYIVLFMALLTALSYISLWRGFKAQREFALS